MVHRPADSRLLTNLLNQEKDFSKQLAQLLDSSNASLASFSAYAAASPPPTSTVIMNVVASLAAADEALGRYTRGVEEWREMMKQLKEAEDEVGNIMRDREILVNRLIKVSKSERKGSTGNFRDSLLLGHNRLPSSTSSLSLSVGHHESPSPSPSRPLSASFTSSSKLAAAQAELQACENHLAAKERELSLKRCVTVRDGLGTRVRALMECGWVWSEVGKQALQVLEELKVDSAEQHTLPSPPRPPLVRDAPIYSLIDDQGHGTQLAERESTRPSSDLSSISPSQSASQRDEESPPPPISIGSLISQLGEPTKKEDADANQHDNLQVQTNTTTRRSSGLSMTTTSSSIYYSPATPATCKLETVTYAPAVALYVPPAKEKGKEREISGLPSPSVAGPSGVDAHEEEGPPPAESELFKDTLPSHTMRIPAPHALDDEYAYRIPTAHQTPPPSQPVSSPSKRGQQHDRHQSSSPGPSTPQSTSSFTRSTSLSQHQHQLVSITAPRRVLERRITEEDIRRMSLEKDGNEEEGASSSLEEEIVDERKLVKEGKLEVVENPRFMSEERKREVERLKKKREEEERKRREREEKEREKEKEKEKEKKRFSFFHSSPNVADIKEHETGHVRFTEEPDQLPSGSGSSPSKLRLTPSSPSPSKGFLGSLKGFFGGSKQSPVSSPLQSPVSHHRSRSLSLSRGATVSDEDEDDDGDDSDSDASARGGRGGLHGILRGKKSKTKNKDREKGKERDATPRWYTRTDKNIREIVERRGSYEGVVSSNSGTGRNSVGRGLAGNAALNAGRPPPLRNRAVSDVGIGNSTSHSISISGTSPSSGRRLKKSRVGGPSGGMRSDGDDSGVEPLPPPPSSAKSVSGRAPIPAFSAGGPSSILKASPAPAPVIARRSASEDVDSLRRRKSWVDVEAVEDREGEEDEDEGDEEVDEEGIVDLGRRRRTASELGQSASAAKSVVPPLQPKSALSKKGGIAKGSAVASTAAQVKTAQVKTKTTKDYSSDTAAVASSSAQGVKRKKSLTKKKGQATTAATAPPPSAPAPAPSVTASTMSIVIPPLPSTMPPVPTAPPPSNAAAAATSTPVRKGSLRAPSSTSSSPYPTPTHRGTQSASAVTLATVLPANNDKPSGTLVSRSSSSSNTAAGAAQRSHQPMMPMALGWKWDSAAGGAGLSRNSSITSAASAPPASSSAVVGGKAGRGGKRQSVASGSGSAGLVRRSSFGGSGAASSSSTTSPSAAAPATAASKAPVTSTTTNSSVVHPSASANTPSLMSIVEGVSKANKEGWGQEKTRKSVGGTQKPATATTMTVELGLVKAPAPVKKAVLANLDEGQVKGLGEGAHGAMRVGGSARGMTSTSSLATVTPATTTTSSSKNAAPALFEIRAPGSVFDARNDPSSGTESMPVLAQPQPRLASPSSPSIPKQQQQREELQVWATGTVPGGGGGSMTMTKAPSPLRGVLRNSSTSRSPSPATVRSNGRPPQTQPPAQSRPTAPVLGGEKEETAPSPVDGTLPWGADGALKPRADDSAVDKGKGKEKDLVVVPPSPAETVDGTSDTETYETGNESFSDHSEQQAAVATAPAVIVSQVDSPPATSKLANGTANGHALGYHDDDHGHPGSPKSGSVLSHSDTSTLRGPHDQSLQPHGAASSADGASTTSTPRRRKSVRVSLQPTFSPSPPAIEYTPDEEQKEYSPWAATDSSRQIESKSVPHHHHHHHPHHPLPKPTTIATQLLSRPLQPSPSAAAAASSGEGERVRDMWADSDESENEHYARAKRLLTRAAKKEKDVQLLVANRSR